jgi:hypothetical protein
MMPSDGECLGYSDVGAKDPLMTETSEREDVFQTKWDPHSKQNQPWKQGEPTSDVKIRRRTVKNDAPAGPTHTWREIGRHGAVWREHRETIQWQPGETEEDVRQ